MTNEVPEITYRNGVFLSNAALPRDRSDLCACWGTEAQKKVRTMLRKKQRIICCDATARAGVIAQGLALMNCGVFTTSVEDIVLAHYVELPARSEAR